MDALPPEILLQIFKHFDHFTVLTVLRPVCKSFSYACAILIPSLKISGLPPALWEKVFSNIETYKTLYRISRCSSSFRSLLQSTGVPQLQATSFRLPLPASDSKSTAPQLLHSSAKLEQHPAFENICCRIEHGSLIYHKTGNNCPTDLLSFPMSEENATNPPVRQLLVKFSARYGVTLRPVLITKTRGAGNNNKKLGGARGVTVGDVYRAMKRLFVEPLTEKQAKALKEMRDWEIRKHEAVKKAVSKIERESTETSEATSSATTSTSTATASSAAETTPAAKEEEELPKEPIIEHDESEIYFEQPMVAEFTGHPGDKVQRQREFLYDFPYVYASTRIDTISASGVQVFVLSYH
ncbi:hypothetical protein H072_4662 [Dactylellina haptotyla CBS 200.50]|uniref:F-box domain-containing protein n=1 Tax=Dactylellina haptotyla (strain CBS 200.50) TaxID=1284197 RepID=S8BPR8_DACHA|nr:hypothetical protein H072_4662 [Dactylellina haptotyla CBS 200.50]